MSDQIQKFLDEAEKDRNQSSIASADRRFSSDAAAKKAFSYYTTAILNLNLWNESSTVNNYRLYNENGQEISDESLRKNVFIRIYMPGSGKYDWIKIIEIDESPDEYIITVKPSHDPTDQDSGKAKTSHFFTSQATNNFCIRRLEATVNFYVIGLEEKQNTGETKNTLETIRNVLTANVAPYLGIQKGEWTSFCQKFIDSYQSPDQP